MVARGPDARPGPLIGGRRRPFGHLRNTTGADIVIGIGEDRELIGVEDAQAEDEKLSQSIYEATGQEVKPQINLVSHDGKEFVVIRVRFFDGPEPLAMESPGKTERIVFERVGSTSIPVSDKRLEVMRQEREGRNGLDQLPQPKATLDDVDL